MCHVLGAFLARNVHLVSPPSIGSWEVVPPPTLFNIDFLISKLIVKMRGRRPEVICSGDTNPKTESPVAQVQVKEKKDVSQKKKKKKDDESQRKEDEGQKKEDTEPLNLEAVEKQVGWLLNEQLAQRDVIDKMQTLIHDLVRILKESNIKIPATVQHAAEEPESPNNSPKKSDKTSAVEEKEVTPEPDSAEDEEEETKKSQDEEEVPEQEGQEMEETVEAEASNDEGEHTDLEDLAESKAGKKKKRKEMRAAMKLKMKEKMRAMRRKAKRRAERKRAAAAAAREATSEPSTTTAPHLQENPVGSPIRSRKRKDKDAPPPEDSYLRFKRRR